MGRKSSYKKIKKINKTTQGVIVPSADSSSIAAGYLRLFVLASLCFLIVFSPFRKGVFLEKDFLWLHLCAFGLFVLWWIARMLRRDGVFFETPLHYCLAGLLLFYILSLFSAISIRPAFGEVLRVANYSAIFVMSYDLCKRGIAPFGRIKLGFVGKKGGSATPVTGRPAVFVILHVLAASALVLAVYSLGAAAGAWESHFVYMPPRIWSPLGYANTTGAYLSVSFFILLALCLFPAGQARYVVYAAASSLLMIATVLTYSRGTWLLLPVAALLFIVLPGVSARGRAFVYLLATVPVSLVTAFLLDGIFRSDSPGTAWGYLILAVALSAGGAFAAEVYLAAPAKKRVAVAGAAALLCVAAGMGFVFQRLFAPLQLAAAAGEAQGKRYLEHIVDNAVPGEAYTISLEAEAVRVGDTPEGYAWRLWVIGGDERYRQSILFDHRENGPHGWERREFAFIAPEGTRRLDVRVGTLGPGITLTVRNVVLKGAGKDRNLDFAWHRLLPGPLYRRIFTYRDLEAIDLRFHHYRDAFKIIRDYPVFGTGGGGWKSLYQVYQHKLYWASEVHNHYLQVWLEAGLGALLCFVGLWFFFLRAFLAGLCGGENAVDRLSWMAVGLPALFMGVHSAADYNLSFGAVNVYLFTLLGAAMSLNNAGREKTFSRQRGNSEASGRFRAANLWGFVVAVLLLGVSFSLWSSKILRERAFLKVEEQKVEEAVRLLEEASRRDPFHGENHYLLASIYEQYADSLQEKSPRMSLDMLQNALHRSSLAYRRDPFEPRYNVQYGLLLIKTGELETGLSYVKRIIVLRPYFKEHFVELAKLLLQMAEYCLEAGNTRQVAAMLEEVVGLEEKILAYHGSAGVLHYYIGRAYFLMEDYGRSREYFQNVGTEDENHLSALHLLDLIEIKEAEADS